MQCPVDQTVLQMTDRQGVEIDYCPTCRGVWLDRGELDKLIETSEAQATVRPAPAPSPGPDPRTESPGTPRGRPTSSIRSTRARRTHRTIAAATARTRDPRYGRKRRRESFLGDLFDF